MINDQQPVMIRVAKKKVENKCFATLFFNHKLTFRPGQFIMLWIPGVDEKPYTISFYSKEQFGITIEEKGIFSKKAIRLNTGDLIGIRGPFGNGFDIRFSSNTVAVAGGCGIASLATLVEKPDQDIILIQGARSKELILYPYRFKKPPLFCTDDGSHGIKGFVTDVLEQQIILNKKLDMVYACGPEIMMYNVFKICQKYDIDCQVSLERFMRCGFGVCGACVCDNQIVCKDGPVFDLKKLEHMKDFNTKALLKSGREIELSNK